VAATRRTRSRRAAEGVLTPPLDEPWPALKEAYLLVRRNSASPLARLGISLSDFHCLELCARSPARASALAHAVGVTPAGATDMIDRLARHHLVRRAHDPNDGRVVLVQLTPAGGRVYRDARRYEQAALRRIRSRLTKPERRALSTGLAALRRAAAGSLA